MIKKVISQLGWTQKLADVVLDAYSEFIELKIVLRDWTTSSVIPSWCIRQVWKLHALSNKKEYEEACKRLCRKLIQYQIEVKQDPDSPFDTQSEQIKFTGQVYELRFNHTINGAVWEFNFNPFWKSEYQKNEIPTKSFYKKKEKSLKYKKKSKTLNDNANTTDTAEHNSNKTPENNTNEIDAVHSNNQTNSSNFENTNTIVNTNLSTSSNDNNSAGPTNANSSTLRNENNSPEPAHSNSNDVESPAGPAQNNRLVPMSSQGSSSSSNISSTAYNRKRQRRSFDVKDPVVTRSRAKQMRLTL